MKPQFINRSVIQNKSFSLESHSYKTFLQVWHYHPEFELILILAGTGTRFVGDHIEKFRPGEIVLMGKNLPHMWKYDKSYLSERSNTEAKSLVVHFHDDFINGISKIPEMTDINSLFHLASHGIKFELRKSGTIIQKMTRIFDQQGYDKVMLLINVLKQLAEQKESSTLSSSGYINALKKKESKIMLVYEYVMNNFKEGICLDNAARLANMNPSAFSRYFKRIHKKTFITFINEIKIGYACKLLLEQNYNISQICYESGFNNVSNFNRQFKYYKQMTPSEYINLHCGTN